MRILKKKPNTAVREESFWGFKGLKSGAASTKTVKYEDVIGKIMIRCSFRESLITQQ